MFQKQHFLYRRPLQNGCLPQAQVQDPFSGQMRTMLNFAANDYLNLTQHPRVLRAALESIQDYGAGAGGVPMLSGTLKINQTLENKLAAVKGCERALVYTSGYGANIGALTALLRKNDLAIIDAWAHASLIDGSKHCQSHFFKHNDLASLEAILQRSQSQYQNKLVIVDGVYSMDGDIAKLDQITELAHHYGAWVLVDEAHATGVIGPSGAGTPEYCQVKGKVDVVTGTLSKALGCVGGFVAGSAALIRYLESSSRPYIFSTAPFAAVSAAALEALYVIEEEPEIRHQLWSHIHYFHQALTGLGFDLGASETAIFPLIIGNDFKVKEMASQLHQAGILVNPVFYPAVPRHLARVRLSLSAGLSQADLDTALNHLETIGKRLQII